MYMRKSDVICAPWNAPIKKMEIMSHTTCPGIIDANSKHATITKRFPTINALLVPILSEIKPKTRLPTNTPLFIIASTYPRNDSLIWPWVLKYDAASVSEAASPADAKNVH
jgi:hypothetical protein